MARLHLAYMPTYDREVKEKLGEKVVALLRDEATTRNISSQHFEDLSAELHPDVRGNHLRRVHELRRVCDEAELRNILSVGHSRLNNSFYLNLPIRNSDFPFHL